MSLEEEVKELEAQLAAEQNPEEPKEETVSEPEPSPEPEKEEPKPEVKEPDNSTYARLRWEAAEDRRKAKALEEELAALKNPPKQLPNKEDNWEAHAEARIETTEERLARIEKALEQENSQKKQAYEIEGAKAEFNQYEEQYKAIAPEYEEARSFLVQNIARSIKLLNPGATTTELVRGVEHALLARGRDAVLAGINPAQRIHEEAKQYGFVKEEPKQEKKEAKPNLERLADNKRKSAGLAGTSGGDNPLPSVEAALKLTNAEFSRLSESDFARLEAEARA